MGTQKRAAIGAALLKAIVDAITEDQAITAGDLKEQLTEIAEMLGAEQAIVVNGDSHTMDDLTFAERRKLRDTVRELSGDPDAQPGSVPADDFIPALVYVIRLREEPELKLDEVLTLKWDDVVKDKDNDSVPPSSAAEPAASTSPANGE